LTGGKFGRGGIIIILAIAGFSGLSSQSSKPPDND
jgi:hypothetical protein